MFFSDLAFILKRLWRQKGLVLAWPWDCSLRPPWRSPSRSTPTRLTPTSSIPPWRNLQPRPTARPSPSSSTTWAAGMGPSLSPNYTPANQYIDSQLEDAIGLPLETLTRLVSTDNLQLYPNQTPINRSQRLDLVKLTTLSGVFDQVKLVEGGSPRR